MPHDDYGNEIKAGDRVSMIVGMPGREVIATVKMKRKRLIVEDDEGSMPLAEALKYYLIEVIR